MEANTLQAKDLRCGNLINRYDKNIYVNLGVMQKIQNGSVIYKPIPLSEDWLLKLGFENWGKGKFYKSDEYTRFVLYNVLDGTSNFEVHKIIDPEYYVISCDDNERINFGIDITYVHQLQNLYFGLVGEELTIKE